MNPFAPVPAPPLPAGMTGSDANDPRYKLTPGIYDAGETSVGMKHLAAAEKAGSVSTGHRPPDDPKVDKTISQLGIGGGTCEVPERAEDGDRADSPSPIPISPSRAITFSREIFTA